MVPRPRWLPLRGEPAAGRRWQPAARRLRRGDARRLLPALRGRDGGDAAAAGRSRPDCGRLHGGNLEGRGLDRHRPAGARLGRAWFAGYGWLAFDPTPGRGTLSAVYTLASDSADAVRALGTGRFLDFTPTLPQPTGTGDTRVEPPHVTPGSPGGSSALVASRSRGRGRSWARETGAALARLRRSDPRRSGCGRRAELVAALLDRGASVEAERDARRSCAARPSASSRLPRGRSPRLSPRPDTARAGRERASGAELARAELDRARPRPRESARREAARRRCRCGRSAPGRPPGR